MCANDVLAILTSTRANDHVIVLAEQLSIANNGRMTAALVNWVPNVAPIDGFVFDPLYGRLVEDARKHLQDEQMRLEDRLKAGDARSSFECFFVEVAAARAELGMRARHADISVVARPTKDNAGSADTILEAVLFESGRPTIMAPPDWKRGPIGQNIVVAWKPTREAARALGDARDFIRRAASVSVVTVDASPSRGYGEQPGADVSAHLAVGGARVQLFNLDSGGRSEAEAILDQAAALGADLIVMGGYGRARLSELMFGGVTREMVKNANVPVMMSH